MPPGKDSVFVPTLTDSGLFAAAYGTKSRANQKKVQRQSPWRQQTLSHLGKTARLQFSLWRTRLDGSIDA